MSLTQIKEIFAKQGLSDTERDEQLTKVLDTVEEKAADKGVAEWKAKNGSVMSMFTAQSPAARDPVEVMQDVFQNASYSTDEKQLLFYMSRERFQNRRRMAYISLYVLLGATVVLGIGWIVDAVSHSSAVATCLAGIGELPETLVSDADRAAAIEAVVASNCTQFPFSEVLAKNTEVLTWMGTFFTSIIALYFGASSFRPTS